MYYSICIMGGYGTWCMYSKVHTYVCMGGDGTWCMYSAVHMGGYGTWCMYSKVHTYVRMYGWRWYLVYVHTVQYVWVDMVPGVCTVQYIRTYVCTVLYIRTYVCTFLKKTK